MARNSVRTSDVAYKVRGIHRSFAIVTTDAAPGVAQYHNRMPVVLDDSQFDDWMRGTPDQAAGHCHVSAVKAFSGFDGAC